MIHVPNRPDIHMWLRPLEFLLGHQIYPPKKFIRAAGQPAFNDIEPSQKPPEKHLPDPSLFPQTPNDSCCSAAFSCSIKATHLPLATGKKPHFPLA
jgi:hypothetical protein